MIGNVNDEEFKQELKIYTSERLFGKVPLFVDKAILPMNVGKAHLMVERIIARFVALDQNICS